MRAHLGITQADTSPLNIAKGKVPSTSIRNIFGYHPNVSDSFTAVWEGTGDGTTLGNQILPYSFPAEPLTMSIVSTSSSDTSVSILIKGLDENYSEVSAVVPLQGTTPVVVTQPFFRINDVITVSGNAVGDVQVTNGGTLYARVRAGEGKNQAAIYTVPKNCSFYLTRINAFSADASATPQSKTSFLRNFITTSTGVALRVGELSFNNSLTITRAAPFKYDEGTDIQIQMKTFSGTHETSCFAEGYLVDITKER